MPSDRRPADPIHRAVSVLGSLLLAVALVGLWRAVETPPPDAPAPAVSAAPEAAGGSARLPAPRG